MRVALKPHHSTFILLDSNTDMARFNANCPHPYHHPAGTTIIQCKPEVKDKLVDFCHSKGFRITSMQASDQPVG